MSYLAFICLALLAAAAGCDGSYYYPDSYQPYPYNFHPYNTFGLHHKPIPYDYYLRPYNAPFASPPPPSAVPPAVYPIHTQYHAQDELGQYSFGYSGGPSSRAESRDAYGTVRGSYNYVDSDGILQTQHYVADALGFRVTGTNLPVAPKVSPANTPHPVTDTPEVSAAKDAFRKAYNEEAAPATPAAASDTRKKRSVAPNVYSHSSPHHFFYSFTSGLYHPYPGVHYPHPPPFYPHFAPYKAVPTVPTVSVASTYTSIPSYDDTHVTEPHIPVEDATHVTEPHNTVEDDTHVTEPHNSVQDGTHVTEPHNPVQDGTYVTVPHNPVQDGTHVTVPHNPVQDATHVTVPHNPVQDGTHVTVPHNTVQDGTHVTVPHNPVQDGTSHGH